MFLKFSKKVNIKDATAEDWLEFLGYGGEDRLGYASLDLDINSKIIDWKERDNNVSVGMRFSFPIGKRKK